MHGYPAKGNSRCGRIFQLLVHAKKQQHPSLQSRSWLLQKCRAVAGRSADYLELVCTVLSNKHGCLTNASPGDLQESRFWGRIFGNTAVRQLVLAKGEGL